MPVKNLFRKAALALTSATLLATTAYSTAQAESRSFEEIAEAAKGQTVYWNAWGGDERINAYIAWAGDMVNDAYGVTVEHVKLSDTATAVSAVLADQTAGRDEGGKIDLIWINGENFASMKRHGLLHGPFVDIMPNSKLVDFAGKPTTKIDFTVPTDGLEAPWGMAQFNFIWDTATVPKPPQSMDELLAWSGQNPGRLSYPRPPDFVGSTFLKQILIAKAPDASVLQNPVNEADFEATSAPLWAYLDALHPSLWRQGREFPANGPAQRQLLDDGELDVMMSFYPSEAGSLVAAGNLPETVKAFGLKGGTIGNTHFVAIPYNAAAREGAMVLANYLMSAEAQATKQNQEFWGDATVLDVDALTGDDKSFFDDLDETSSVNVGAALLEPHPSWMEQVEKVWETRYSN